MNCAPTDRQLLMCVCVHAHRRRLHKPPYTLYTQHTARAVPSMKEYQYQRDTILQIQDSKNYINIFFHV